MKVNIRRSSIKHIKMKKKKKRMRTKGGRAIIKRRRRIGRRPLLDV